jgi:hypothetical protein
VRTGQNRIGAPEQVPAGLVAHVRREVFGKLKPLEVEDCPFANLPDRDVGRWGGGITADQMPEMHWTKPQTPCSLIPSV